MKLSYVDLLGDRERHEIEATVTTDHPASSYGIPVVVLPDGESLDVQSWMILNYQVVKATRDELAALVKALSPYTLPTQAAAAALGAIKSEKKAAAARANGAKSTGRPLTPKGAIKVLATDPNGPKRGKAITALTAAVLNASTYGDPDQSLEDWIAAGDYSGSETVASIAAEWDGGRE